jgi:hypothetical protein
MLGGIVTTASLPTLSWPEKNAPDTSRGHLSQGHFIMRLLQVILALGVQYKSRDLEEWYVIDPLVPNIQCNPLFFP